MQTVTIKTNNGRENSNNNSPIPMTIKRTMRKSPVQLSIHGNKLRKWLDSITRSNGIYYLDLDVAGLKQYSMHYCDHLNDKVMELDYHAGSKDIEHERKEFLEALIFDLSLFPDEPILVFNRVQMENCLRNLAAVYYEHANAVNSIINRMTSTDMLQVFKGGIYQEPRIKDYTIDGIYHALYQGTSRTFAKAQDSYGMHLIILAVQSIFYQITGNKMAA